MTPPDTAEMERLADEIERRMSAMHKPDLWFAQRAADGRFHFSTYDDSAMVAKYLFDNREAILAALRSKPPAPVVEGEVERLRKFLIEGWENTDEIDFSKAADLLTTLSVKLAQVEAERDQQARRASDYHAAAEAALTQRAAAQSRIAELTGALEKIEKTLKIDAREPDLSGDVTEYRIDGNAMYHALNAARAAFKQKGSA